MSRVRRRARDINPALKIRDFYSFGLQVLNEINFARMHPDEFVEKLEELYNSIRNDNCLYVEGIPFLYTNLKESLEDAIDFLTHQKPLKGLIYNKTITQACDYLLDELIIHDGLDDNDSNRYSLENRLSKFGEPLGQTYELIDYGMFDPEFIVINFILCDGDEQKYERNVIFNSKIKFLGIAASILPSDKICTVINFCEEFYDKYESIPIDIQMKYKKSAPKYTTKTIKSYSNQMEPGKQNLNNPKAEEKDYLDNDFDDYDIKRRNSGRVFTMKKNQYMQRRNSIKQKKEEEEKEKQKQRQNNPQRGGTINIQPKVIKTKNVSDTKKEEINNQDEDEEDEFRDDRMVMRRKRTIHDPKRMEVIEEEKYENEDFDREFKIESPVIKKKQKPTREKVNNLESLNKNPNPNQKSNVTNSTVETKYAGDKKITTSTITKTETGEDGKKKVTTTTITHEVGTGEPRYRDKFVKDIPFKSYGRKKYQNQKDFDIDKEMKELEKDFDDQFGHLNLKSEIKPVFESTDDMFEKEDEIEMPDDAISMEVKQKTITDSKGKPVLVVHKTIYYENGENKTIIEKKNIVKK